jgi:endonuclease/exonuclease/phosphatase family metal-dependent hydrolase
MHKKLFTALLFLSFGNQLFSQGLSSLSFGTDSTLEIVTWNIEWFPKNGASTADSVQKIIQALDADIIALQEISDTAAFRQMVDNLPDFEFLVTGGFTGGLAYVYKSSTISVQSIYKIFDTSTDRNFFPRPPAVLTFTFDGKPFVAINNHFKCCGNGFLDMGNTSDEEFRRLGANDQLKQYIGYNFANDNVILLGDLNDILTDAPPHNVFQFFLNDSTNYRFVDLAIAHGPISHWSYPSWPSHLDHILITNELFDDLANPGSEVKTIRVDDYLNGGFSSYDAFVSDHRPVALKLNLNGSSIGILEELDLQIGVYPNPTTGFISVQLINATEPTDIEVYDIYGKLIFKQNHVSEKLNFSIDAPAGVYLIKVKSGAFLVVKRIVKM